MTQGARASGSRRCGRDSCGGHDLLRERLRAFDPRRGRARPEDEERRTVEARRRARATSGSFGPDDDEVDAERAREAEHALGVVGADRDGIRRASAIPGLPGAACSSVRSGDCASFQASACSRPPEPTTRTRTAGVYEGRRRHVSRPSAHRRGRRARRGRRSRRRSSAARCRRRAPRSRSSVSCANVENVV